MFPKNLSCLLFLVSVVLAKDYDEVKMTCLVNKERLARGLKPLGMDERLAKAALLHSQDQARRGEMTHTGADGSDPGMRCERAGFKWTSVSENVAYGYPSEEKVMQAWMKSPGHKANILNTSNTMFGSGMCVGNNKLKYWTQDFGCDGQPKKNVPRCDGHDKQNMYPIKDSDDYNGNAPNHGQRQHNHRPHRHSHRRHKHHPRHALRIYYTPNQPDSDNADYNGHQDNNTQNYGQQPDFGSSLPDQGNNYDGRQGDNSNSYGGQQDSNDNQYDGNQGPDYDNNQQYGGQQDSNDNQYNGNQGPDNNQQYGGQQDSNDNQYNGNQGPDYDNNQQYGGQQDSNDNQYNGNQADNSYENGGQQDSNNDYSKGYTVQEDASQEGESNDLAAEDNHESGDSTSSGNQDFNGKVSFGNQESAPESSDAEESPAQQTVETSEAIQDTPQDNSSED